MKKLFFLVSFLAVLGISSAWAQGTINETLGINSTRNYRVNYSAGNHIAEHVGNTYTWVIYDWDGLSDYSDGSSMSPNDGTAFSTTGSSSAVDLYTYPVTWLKSGDYVIEVTESGNGTSCLTKRRFGVRVFELDLLVTTLESDDTEIPADNSFCNTNSGNVWTNNDNTDLNGTGVNPTIGNTVFKYKIQLFTKDGGSSPTENIAQTFPSATWQFVPTVTNTTPTGGNVSWSYSTGATGTVNNPISVAAATSEVILTLTLKNMVGDEALKYINNLNIASNTVKVDLAGGSAFKDGTEPTTNTNSNIGKQITVNPIPNTSTITSVTP